MSDTDKPRESCGVFGVGPHPEAARLTRLGLYSLQHRGQESAGIFVLREQNGALACESRKGMGLVAEVFRELPDAWWDNPQLMAIGHVRYSTAGSSSLVNAQPFAVEFDCWHLALAHNGTISNGELLRQQLKASGAILQGNTDTELILHLAARLHTPGEPPWEALSKALEQVEGAFSVTALCEAGMAAFRDPHGWRPLVLGKIGGCHVVASETTAFDMVGAEYLREIEPGEFIVFSPDGKMRSWTFADSPRKAHCVFELVYFARPDSHVFGECVYEVRKAFGRQLAREQPADVDVVMPLPDGGVYAAIGYAEEIGKPFDMGVVRNHYVGRTFISPNAEDRRTAVKIKLNPVREAIAGRRVALVDDSIVRGNTSRERVRLLRECGAREVHMRISCPPHIGPCFYGIDFATREQLIANNYSIEEIARLINVDSLGYLSLDGMLGCVRRRDPADYCHACFSRQYPVPPRSAEPPPRRCGSRH